MAGRNTERKGLFKSRPHQFTLDDIGSRFIDQLSSDIYNDPGQIVREIVKNAYDSYELRSDDFPETERNIYLSRYRDRSAGHLIIRDNGHGQDYDTLLENVQFSITRKPSSSFVHPTGFRGLGSWALLGAGSRITVESKIGGDPRIFRLVINAKAIYSKIALDTTLNSILNDRDCIDLFEARANDQTKVRDHYTIVDIECDGPVRAIKGHEINRLYEFTLREDKRLRELLLEYCQTPLVSPENNRAIKAIYASAGYSTTSIYLDGIAVERTLPKDLTLHTEDLLVDGKVVAKVWYADKATETKQLEVPRDLGGPGIQLMKYNVPLGPKNLYSTPETAESGKKRGATQANVLNWFIGEVHIISDYIQPNANGTDLRADNARDEFIVTLRQFYRALVKKARAKSSRLSNKRKLTKVIELARGSADERRTSRALSAAARAEEILGDRQKRAEMVADDPAIEPLLKDAKTALSRFPNAGKTRKAPAAKSRAKAASAVSTASQAAHEKLLPIMPQFDQLDLSPQDADQVLRIANAIAIEVAKIDELDLDDDQRAGLLDALAELFT